MAKAFKWRTRNSGYVYVDSECGSDVFGNGTMQNPYATLGKAWRGHTVAYPNNIVCRGYFSEDMADGIHDRGTIQADYMGAATFDGQDIFTIYGFSLPNMIVKNCTHGKADTTVFRDSPLFAGVGRALYAAYVGHATFVSGPAAASVCQMGCAPYFGCVSGNDATTYGGVVAPRPNPAYGLWFASGDGGGQRLRRYSIYDVPKSIRSYSRDNRQWRHEGCIYGKVAFYLNDGLSFDRCTFASDCEWYNEDDRFIPVGNTSAERLASLRAWIASTTIKPSNATSKTKCVFTDDCVLSDLTSEEIWNDPDNGDLTLRYDKLNSDTYANGSYRGWQPPAIRIPILTDSQGKAATWDENTACGLISVADNAIVIADKTNPANYGEIKSKVLTTDPSKVAIAGIFALCARQLSQTGVGISASSNLGNTYTTGEQLPVGRYFVRGGDVLYRGLYVAEDTVLVVSASDTDKSASAVNGATVTLVEITDANTPHNMYVRTSPIVYAYIKASDGLQAGATYLNNGSDNITYRGRVIAPNESFEAVNSTDTFSHPDANRKVAVLFDDTRVPSEPWISADMWGEYFAGRVGATYQTDANGEILSSGNYLAWLPSSEGGYDSSLIKSRAQARYLQLKIAAYK